MWWGKGGWFLKFKECVSDRFQKNDCGDQLKRLND
jgi:hypothetical protein